MSDFDDERGGLPRDLTKKILTLGLGAYFLTEDTVRRYVKDAKIPRDLAKTITTNAVKGKDELYAFVAGELSGFLKQMDLQEEVGRFVARHRIKINAEIEFVPRDDVPRPFEDSDESEPVDGKPSEPGAKKKPPLEWNVSFKGPGASRPEGSSEEEPRLE